MVDIKQETEPLLSASTTEDKVQSNRHFFLLTVIGCVHFAAFAALNPIQQFYVIGETAKKFGQHETSYDTYCPSSATNNANNTSDKVQEESASILTFLTFFSTALAVIPILVLGSLTDRYGRKIPLLISLSGLLAKEVVMLVTVYEGLSLWYLVVGEIFLGLTGHFGLALAAMMGMIADMTKAGRERAIKITILEAVVASSVAIANLGIGFWIKDGNYKHPLVMSVSLSIVSIILTAWCLPETHTNANRTSSSVFIKEMIKALVKLYRKDKRRPILIVGQVIFCVNVGAILGKANVVTLYLLNHPLCWSEVHVQVFSCITTLVNWITIVLGLRLLHKYMKDSALVVMGTVSGLISLIALALARHDYVVYICKYTLEQPDFVITRCRNENYL